MTSVKADTVSNPCQLFGLPMHTRITTMLIPISNDNRIITHFLRIHIALKIGCLLPRCSFLFVLFIDVDKH